MPIMESPRITSVRVEGSTVPQPPMQRVHRRRTPLTRTELDEARRLEAARLEWDEWYITAEQARAIPTEALSPGLLSRIQ